MAGKIAIILGSKNDTEELKDGFRLLKSLKIPYEMQIISAHRNPDKLRDYCKTVEKKGVQAVIACAGMSAALPGFVASYVNIPVIGVALKGGLLEGLDALFAMVSIPKGLGIVSSGIGKSAFINAIIFSLAIISLKDKEYLSKLKTLKAKWKK